MYPTKEQIIFGQIMTAQSLLQYIRDQMKLSTLPEEKRVHLDYALVAIDIVVEAMTKEFNDAGNPN